MIADEHWKLSAKYAVSLEESVTLKRRKLRLNRHSRRKPVGFKTVVVEKYRFRLSSIRIANLMNTTVSIHYPIIAYRS